MAGHPRRAEPPFTDNIGQDGRFKASSAVAHRVSGLMDGRDPATVVLHCGSGVSANPNPLAMRGGRPGAAQCAPGAGAEWCSDPTTSGGTRLKGTKYASAMAQTPTTPCQANSLQHRTADAARSQTSDLIFDWAKFTIHFNGSRNAAYEADTARTREWKGTAHV